MVVIVDYGVGNLFSLKSSLCAVGAEVTVSADAEVIRGAERIILPGVGAFGDAVKKLRDCGLFEVLREVADKGTPMMGICLGMQLLFDKSFEYGEHEGLGLIQGEIRPISEVIGKGLKVPHIGWNGLSFVGEHPLFEGLSEGDCVYFVHSFYGAKCEESVIATAEYGAPLTAAVAKGNVMGCQFHPEKSGNVGLRILKNFCKEGRIC